MKNFQELEIEYYRKIERKTRIIEKKKKEVEKLEKEKGDIVTEACVKFNLFNPCNFAKSYVRTPEGGLALYIPERRYWPKLPEGQRYFVDWYGQMPLKVGHYERLKKIPKK